MNALEISTIGKVTKRLVPFLIICYFVAYLDRVNVGFAALTMNKDLGLSQTAFGFSAGIFFIAYFIFGRSAASTPQSRCSSPPPASPHRRRWTIRR